MEIETHKSINRSLCGDPVALEPGRALVRLATTPNMAADARGLVHGGFVFGLADYAAMLAVNHPHVVLGQAETQFLKPVKTGDMLEARAEVVKPDSDRKRRVEVSVYRGDDLVMRGVFVCFILEKHVLDR